MAKTKADLIPRRLADVSNLRQRLILPDGW